MFDQLTSTIRANMEKDASGHDFSHVERVIKNATNINLIEKQNPEAVYLTALLHDTYDEKFYQGDIKHDLSQLLRENVVTLNQDDFAQLLNDLTNMGFRGGFTEAKLSPIGYIVEDADRLDAMGAIGIARAFAYGGAKGRKMIDSMANYQPIVSHNDYRNADRATVFHFYDKLFKLKDIMHTKRGQELALQRHDFMLDFLKQLRDECDE